MKIKAASDQLAVAASVQTAPIFPPDLAVRPPKGCVTMRIQNQV